jgi:hypothetical protein
MTGGVEGGVDSDAAAAEAARQREIARQQAEAAARAQAKAEADAAQAEGGTGDVAQASAVSGPGDVPAETDPGFNEAVAADTAGPNPASVDASGSYLHGDPSMGPNRSGDNGDHDETPVAATGLASGMFTASKAIQSLTVSKDEDPRDTAEIAAARAQLVAMRDAPEGTYSAEVLQQIDDELAAYTALNDFDDAKVAFNKGMQPLPEQRAALERSYAKIANSDILQPEVKLQMEAILFATSDEGMAIQANLQTALAGIEATSADKVGASGHAGKNARHNQREALKAYQEAYAAYQEAVPPRLAATLPASASDYLAAHAADLATAGDTAGAENTRMHAEAYFSCYDKHSDVLIASATLPKAQDTQAEASAFTQKLEKLDVHIATQAQLHQSRDDMATALETLGNSDLGTLVDADAATQTLSELDDAVMRYNDAMALNEGDEGHLSTEQLLADTAERYLTDGDFAAAKTYLHRLQDHNPSSAPYVANRLQAVDAGIAAYNSEHADKDDDMLSLAQSQLEALDKAYTQEVKAFWSQDATNIGGVARDQATRLGLGDQAYRDAKQEADARLAYLQEVTSAFEAGDPDVSLYDLNQARSEANKAVTHAIDLNTKGDVKGAEFSAAVAQGVRDTSIATTVLVATGGAAGIGAAGSMGLAAAGKGLAAGGIASVAMTGASWAGHKMHGLESEFSLTRELATDGINIATSLAFAPGGVLAGQAMNVGTATAKQAALRAVTNAAAEASIDGAGEALLTYGTTGDLKQAMTAGTTSFASSAGVSIATAGLGGNAAEDMVGTQLQQFFKQAGREATETGTTAGATGGIVYASTGLTTGDWDMARDQAYMAATNATIGSGMTKGVMGQASRIHQQEQAQQTALLGDLAQLGADFNALPPQMQLALLASGSEATNLMAVASANESGLSQAHRTAIATQAVDYTPVAAEEEPDEAGTELTPGHELATDAEAAEGMSLEQEFALNAARQRLEAQWQQGRNDLAVAISGDVERAMQTSEPVLQFTDRSDGGIKNLASDRADRHQALGDVIHTIGRTGPEAEALMAHARKQGMVIAVSRDLPYGAAYVAGDNANNGYDTLLISEDLSSKSPARQAEAIAHELKHAHNEGKHGELYTPTPAAFRPADAADIATQQKAFADSAVAGFVANEREAHITGMRTAQSIDPDIAFSGYKKQIAAVLESAADPQNLTANETAAIDAIIRDHPDYKAEAAELATAASRTFADIYGTTDKPKLDTHTPDANKKLVTQQPMADVPADRFTPPSDQKPLSKTSLPGGFDRQNGWINTPGQKILPEYQVENIQALYLQAHDFRHALRDEYQSGGNVGVGRFDIQGLTTDPSFIVAHSLIDRSDSPALHTALPPDVDLVSMDSIWKGEPGGDTRFEVYAAPDYQGQWRFPTHEGRVHHDGDDTDHSGYAVHVRKNDSELKILSELDRRIQDQELQDRIADKERTGNVVLYTEREPCLSCGDVVAQFQEKYPNIDITVIHTDDTTLYPTNAVNPEDALSAGQYRVSGEGDRKQLEWVPRSRLPYTDDNNPFGPSKANAPRTVQDIVDEKGGIAGDNAGVKLSADSAELDKLVNIWETISTKPIPEEVKNNIHMMRRMVHLYENNPNRKRDLMFKSHDLEAHGLPVPQNNLDYTGEIRGSVFETTAKHLRETGELPSFNQIKKAVEIEQLDYDDHLETPLPSDDTIREWQAEAAEQVPTWFSETEPPYYLLHGEDALSPEELVAAYPNRVETEGNAAHQSAVDSANSTFYPDRVVQKWTDRAVNDVPKYYYDNLHAMQRMIKLYEDNPHAQHDLLFDDHDARAHAFPVPQNPLNKEGELRGAAFEKASSHFIIHKTLPDFNTIKGAVLNEYSILKPDPILEPDVPKLKKPTDDEIWQWMAEIQEQVPTWYTDTPYYLTHGKDALSPEELAARYPQSKTVADIIAKNGGIAGDNNASRLSGTEGDEAGDIDVDAAIESTKAQLKLEDNLAISRVARREKPLIPEDFQIVATQKAQIVEQNGDYGVQTWFEFHDLAGNKVAQSDYAFAPKMAFLNHDAGQHRLSLGVKGYMKDGSGSVQIGPAESIVHDSTLLKKDVNVHSKKGVMGFFSEGYFAPQMASEKILNFSPNKHALSSDSDFVGELTAIDQAFYSWLGLGQRSHFPDDLPAIMGKESFEFALSPASTQKLVRANMQYASHKVREDTASLSEGHQLSKSAADKVAEFKEYRDFFKKLIEIGHPTDEGQTSEGNNIQVSQLDTIPLSNEILAQINPQKANTNCSHCAIAVDRYLSGEGISTALPFEASGGEITRIENSYLDGSGQPIRFQEISASADSNVLSEIAYSLENAGHGTKGIINVQFNEGKNHTFNIVNLNGTIYLVDGQTGRKQSIRSEDAEKGTLVSFIKEQFSDIRKLSVDDVAGEALNKIASDNIESISFLNTSGARYLSEENNGPWNPALAKRLNRQNNREWQNFLTNPDNLDFTPQLNRFLRDQDNNPAMTELKTREIMAAFMAPDDSVSSEALLERRKAMLALITDNRGSKAFTDDIADMAAFTEAASMMVDDGLTLDDVLDILTSPNRSDKSHTETQTLGKVLDLGLNVQTARVPLDRPLSDAEIREITFSDTQAQMVRDLQTTIDGQPLLDALKTDYAFDPNEPGSRKRARDAAINAVREGWLDFELSMVSFDKLRQSYAKEDASITDIADIPDDVMQQMQFPDRAIEGAFVLYKVKGEDTYKALPYMSLGGKGSVDGSKILADLPNDLEEAIFLHNHPFGDYQFYPQNGLSGDDTQKSGDIYALHSHYDILKRRYGITPDIATLGSIDSLTGVVTMLSIGNGVPADKQGIPEVIARNQTLPGSVYVGNRPLSRAFDTQDVVSDTFGGNDYGLRKTGYQNGFQELIAQGIQNKAQAVGRYTSNSLRGYDVAAAAMLLRDDTQFTADLKLNTNLQSGSDDFWPSVLAVVVSSKKAVTGEHLAALKSLTTKLWSYSKTPEHNNYYHDTVCMQRYMGTVTKTEVDLYNEAVANAKFISEIETYYNSYIKPEIKLGEPLSPAAKGFLQGIYQAVQDRRKELELAETPDMQVSDAEFDQFKQDAQAGFLNQAIMTDAAFSDAVSPNQGGERGLEYQAFGRYIPRKVAEKIVRARAAQARAQHVEASRDKRHAQALERNYKIESRVEAQTRPADYVYSGEPYRPSAENASWTRHFDLSSSRARRRVVQTDTTASSTSSQRMSYNRLAHVDGPDFIGLVQFTRALNAWQEQHKFTKEITIGNADKAKVNAFFDKYERQLSSDQFFAFQALKEEVLGTHSAPDAYDMHHRVIQIFQRANTSGRSLEYEAFGLVTDNEKANTFNPYFSDLNPKATAVDASKHTIGRALLLANVLDSIDTTLEYNARSSPEVSSIPTDLLASIAQSDDPANAAIRAAEQLRKNPNPDIKAYVQFLQNGPARINPDEATTAQRKQFGTHVRENYLDYTGHALSTDSGPISVPEKYQMVGSLRGGFYALDGQLWLSSKSQAAHYLLLTGQASLKVAPWSIPSQTDHVIVPKTDAVLANKVLGTGVSYTAYEARQVVERLGQAGVTAKVIARDMGISFDFEKLDPKEIVRSSLPNDEVITTVRRFSDHTVSGDPLHTDVKPAKAIRKDTVYFADPKNQYHRRRSYQPHGAETLRKTPGLYPGAEAGPTPGIGRTRNYYEILPQPDTTADYLFIRAKTPEEKQAIFDQIVLFAAEANVMNVNNQGEVGLGYGINGLDSPLNNNPLQDFGYFKELGQFLFTKSTSLSQRETLARTVRSVARLIKDQYGFEPNYDSYFLKHGYPMDIVNEYKRKTEIHHSNGTFKVE